MDGWIYHQSLKNDDETSPFVSRKVAYVGDLNQGSYSGGIVNIDTAQFSNSGMYCSLSEGFLEIPLVVSLSPVSSVTGFGSAKCNYACSLKNGFHHLIDNISIQYENTQIVPATPYTNMYVSYKLLTTLSQSDQIKMGASIGFWSDSVDSFNFVSSGTAADGQGVCNNRNMGFENLWTNYTGRIYSDTAISANASPTVVSAVSAGGALTGIYTATCPDGTNTNLTSANFGMYKRQQPFAFNPAVTPHSSFVSSTNVAQIAANYYYDSASDSGYKAWFITARVYLRHLHSFFENMPLVRGAYLSIKMQLNLSSQVITVGSRAAVSEASSTGQGGRGTPKGITLSMGTPTMVGNTNPLMLASGEVGQGSASLPAGSYNYQINVYKTTLTSGTSISHTLQNIRLYMPLYQFKPDFEANYLHQPIKAVTFKDISKYQYTGLATNGVMNFLVANGIVDAKTLIIVPVVNSASNGALALSPIQSVFTTEPATTSPLAVVTDFNVRVGGLPILPSNIVYNWEMFANELQQQNAISGGLCDGITSGLISEYSYSLMHRYAVVDLSRRTTTAEDRVPKSIEILLRNLTQLTMDYHIFVETEKTIYISADTGTLMSSPTG